MATDVNTALRSFMREVVNLDRDQTKLARASRDWLLDQVHQFPSSVDAFPNSYTEVDMPMGSFHRRTKHRPLDDIDQIVGLSAEGSTYTTFSDRIELNVNSNSARLLGLCHEGGAILNSRRVLNKFVSALTQVPQYRRADIGRNGEAAVIGLASYEWSFDIVPAFFTKPEGDGRTYYLIPDGAGHWKKTDPRIDEQRVRKVDQAHGGHLLPCIRLVKYWNSRRSVPTIGSYALESMVVSHYEALIGVSAATEYIDIEFRNVLRSLSSAIYLAVPDPKGIQGDLNSLSWWDRIQFAQKATADALLIDQALEAERQGNHRSAMARWRDVIGPSFPEYG